MNTTRSTIKNCNCSVALRHIVAATLFLGAVGAQAANVPNFSKQIDLNVREQPVGQFSMALFRQLNVPLKMHDSFEGLVNGRFNTTARNIYDDLTRAFDLVVYYDGAVAHAYKSNGISRTLIPMSVSKANQLARVARKLNLPDNRNTVATVENGLIATGTPRFVEQIRELIPTVAVTQVNSNQKSPTPAPQPVTQAPYVYPRIYRVFTLKHAWAEDTNFNVGGQSVTIPGVATLMKELITGTELVYDKYSPAKTPNTIPGLRGKGLQLVNESSNVNQPVDSNRFATSSESKVDDIKIVADTRLNAVIIHDTADRMPAYEDLIRKLDVPSKMVEIEATIIDINTDRSRELGINWRYQGDDGAFLFGGGSPGDNFFQQGTTAITQGRGGVLSFMLGEPGEFLARVRALEERGAAKIVSKPHVITLSDVEAVLGATTEFFVRVAGQEEVDLFNVPVGTLLRVTPHVFSDNGLNRIKLLVNIEDGSQSPNQSVDSIPVVERANISTQAVVTEGDSLLVGGLVRDSYRKTDYRVPLLGSIPGIGRLFRSESNTSSRVERLFLITPRLADGIGFDGTRNLPKLQGAPNEILSDSGKRGNSTIWPTQDTRRLWPREQNITTSSTAYSPQSGTGATSGTGYGAVRQPQAFTVKTENFATNRQAYAQPYNQYPTQDTVVHIPRNQIPQTYSQVQSRPAVNAAPAANVASPVSKFKVEPWDAAATPVVATGYQSTVAPASSRVQPVTGYESSYGNRSATSNVYENTNLRSYGTGAGASAETLRPYATSNTNVYSTNTVNTEATSTATFNSDLNYEYVNGRWQSTPAVR